MCVCVCMHMYMCAHCECVNVCVRVSVHVCVFTQGDGISYETLKEICVSVKERGWSLDNLAFGSGGGLLQKLHRDTQKCAFKCCYARCD